MSERWHSREAHALTTLAGVRDPIRAMVKLAQQLLDEAGMDRPPCDPRIPASFRNVRDIREARMENAARLFPDGNYLIIEVNEEHTSGKKNFSANHETSHTLFPTYNRSAIDDLDTGRYSIAAEEEFLCDVGAATLLLDPRLLRPLAIEMGPSIATLMHLAELFQASLEATARQLAQLDLWSSAFVFWEPGLRKQQRPSPGQLFIPGMDSIGVPGKKWRVTRAYPTAQFGAYIPVNKSVDGDSLIAQAGVHDGHTFGTEIIDLGSTVLKAHCQNIYAPYRSRSEQRPRIISLLVPATTQIAVAFRPPNLPAAIL